MFKKQEIYEVPYGYRAKVGLVVVGPNLNPTPEICRMLPDYVQIRETRIHMDPVVNVEECSKLSEPLGNAASLLAEGLSSPILGNRSAIAFACTAGSLVGGPGWDKKEIEMMETPRPISPVLMRFLRWSHKVKAFPVPPQQPQQKKRCVFWDSKKS